uniref:Uncharacterized protein n=1 Tax=Ditylenchus dipsaci TaxID=166011 RepID=A0A915DUU4_9BILA
MPQELLSRMPNVGYKIKYDANGHHGLGETRSGKSKASIRRNIEHKLLQLFIKITYSIILRANPSGPNPDGLVMDVIMQMIMRLRIKASYEKLKLESIRTETERMKLVMVVKKWDTNLQGSR